MREDRSDRAFEPFFKKRLYDQILNTFALWFLLFGLVGLIIPIMRLMVPREDRIYVVAAAAIASIIAFGAIGADIFVRVRRQLLVKQLGLALDLEADSQLTDGWAGVIHNRNLIGYIPAALVFVLVSTFGLFYVLFPSELTPFLRQNFFLLSGTFSSGGPDSGGIVFQQQVRSAVAVFAGFTGAYAWSIRYFFREIEAGRFSAYSFINGTGALLAGSLGTLILWHIVAAALGSKEALSLDASTLFAAGIIAGYVCAVPVPAKLPEGISRLLWPRGLSAPLIPLQWVDGLSHAARRQLMFLRIYDVQNLATANPLLLAVATSYNLNEIIDWIGQSRLILRIKDQQRLSMLRQRSVRTIFELVDAVPEVGAAYEIGRILLSAPTPPLLTPPGPETIEPGGRESPPEIVFRLAENERQDPAFQRLNAIRRAARTNGGLPRSDLREPASDIKTDTDEVPTRSDQPAPAMRPATGTSQAERLPVVARYPEIAMKRWSDGDRVNLLFSIDLRPDASGDAVSNDWTDLIIVVRLLCDDVEFVEDEGAIIVRRDEASLPCHLFGRLRGDGVDVQVRALFYFRSRFCGSFARSFTVARSVGAAVVDTAPIVEAPPPPLRLLGAFPDLTVEITVAPHDRTTQTWRLRSERLRQSQGYYGKLLGQTSLPDAADFLDSYQEAFRSPDPDQMLALLHGVGVRLYRHAADVFKEAYWFLRESRDGGTADFSIQFITEDGVTPFELMVPQREGREFDHLAVTHPIARWVLWRYESTPDLVQQIPQGDVCLALPEYNNELRKDVAPIGAYYAIVQDYRRLQARISGGVSAEFKSLMSAKFPLSILVYHGHGAAGSGTTARLLLADRDVFNTEIDTTATTLGTKHRTLVVLNACRTGLDRIELGTVDSWATTLVRRSFGGVIAPLWDIDFEEAHRFAIDLIAAIRAGTTIGVAMRDLRVKLRDTTPSVLAYVCYADVAAQIG